MRLSGSNFVQRIFGWQGKVVTAISAMLIGFVMALPALAALPSCPYSPNLYAGGTDSNSNAVWGVHGYISIPSSSPSVPSKNEYFTDEAVHVVANTPSTSAKGLEVGWYVGYGAQTGTYVTSPHLYCTYNGPNETDGPAASLSSDYWYSAYVDSSNNAQFRVNDGSLNLWSVSDYSYPGSPDGFAVALGETDNSTLPMGPSTLSGLQDYPGGSWGNWPDLSACADSPYSAVKNSNDSVSDS